MNTDIAGTFHADVARKLFGIVCVAAAKKTCCDQRESVCKTIKRVLIAHGSVRGC